jgi:ATP-dependent Clp protease ATP-binding subunit ClpC
LASQRGTLSRRKITPELSLALNQADAVMRRKNQRVMTAEMLLLACVLSPDTEAHRLLRQFGQQNGYNWDMLVQDVERAANDRRPPKDEQFDFVTEQSKRASLGGELLVVLDDGLTLAETYADGRCSTAHALAVMTKIQVGTHWLLNRRGITEQLVLNAVIGPAAAGPVPSQLPKAKTLPYTPVFHRTRLESRLVNLLSMKSERNVILVGPTGVGKRSLVLGVGQLIVKGDGPFGLQSVVELDERKLLDDAVATVEAGISRARGGILFVPDIARFFGGLRADFREEAGNALQKAFISDEVVIIGTATEESHAKKLKDARVIVEHSQVLRVPPTTVDETVDILSAVKPKFESDYDLHIADHSLKETARLAGRYYTAKPLPGAAIDLLHRACANVKTSHRGRTEDSPASDNQLDPDDVMITASMLTGIPVNTMGADERNRYINMVTHLQQRIIGQETAVLALSRAVKMARVGLKDPKRPIGSFLFLGPTGVGKSELAKALAEFMFGTERALITLDMSEYMDASSVNRLIGSPPGYVGHEQGGQLTDAVKRQPYSVILFDEVEKANTKVFDTLLQVMDEGRLTSGQGETVGFSECVILMTSNIGGHHLADVRLGDEIPTNPDDESGSPAYHQDNIAKMLDAGFSDDELVTLFGADPTFALSRDDFDGEISKANIIDKLVELSGQKAQFDLLLELAEKYNPAKFAAHEPYFNWGVACQRAETELKAHFRPEFLNRLDDIIYFHPLNDDHLRRILELLLKKEAELLAGQSLTLQINDKAKSWLIEQNDHPEWGARPLRRLIQRHIREALAEYLLEKNPPPGTEMRVQVKSGRLQISQVKQRGKS